MSVSDCLVFCIVEGCVISQMHADGREGLDYIIVLGAQVRKDGPSPVLKYRLDKAVEYLNENPDTVCIVSGGQGSNEPWSEAEGMARYLQEKGIDTARILPEDKSQTTEQNITNSKMLMKEGASVGIVTNNFHVFRALQIAKSTDFPMSVELRRIPHQNICRTICCGNFCRDEVAVIEKMGAVKKLPDRKIAQTVRSERFFGIINYATK